MFRKAYFLLLCLMLMCVVASAAEDLDHRIEEALKLLKVPGAAIGVVVDGEIVWAKGYGLRDVSKGLPVDEHTVFGVGSCTKAFTAMLIGQLVDEGKLAWDDTVVSHLPSLQFFDPQLTAAVTLRDLIAHRTGIPRHDAIWYCNPIDRSEVLKLLPYLEPIYPFREQFLYNNMMYSVAAMVMEQITDESWEEMVHNRLLIPLGMHDAHAMLLSSNYSLPYAEIDGEVRELNFQHIYPVAPGGGLNISAIDMLQWVKLQLSDGSLDDFHCVNPSTLAEMHTSQMPLSKFNSCENYQDYGLGWFLGAYRGHRSVSHGGAINGFISDVFLLIEKKIGVVVLTNSSSSGSYAVWAVRNLILDELLGEKGEDWIQVSKALYEEEKKKLPPSHTEFDILPLYPLEKYIGTYTHPAYGTIQISREGNHLRVNYGHSTFPLWYKSEDYCEGFIPELLVFGLHRKIEATFIPDKSGSISEARLTFEPLGPPIVFIRQ